jgi:amino acid adenylation domain-containing protein
MRELNASGSTSSSADKGAAREKLMSLLLSQEREKQARARAVISRVPRGDLIPLSYAQERLWFLEQLAISGTTYNAPLALRLRGALQELALERSLDELARRHESLRTRFGVRDGMPHQVIDPPGPVNLSRVDLTLVGEPQDRESQLSERIHREQRHRFDLGEGPLFRAVLIKLAPEEHVLILIMHHIVSDGWSKGILLSELSTLYRIHVGDFRSSLPEPVVQYADYAIWQRSPSQQSSLQRELNYWRRQLSGAPPLLQLPTDRPRPPVESFKGGEVKFALPLELSRALRDLARREGATLFMTILALYQILLSRWSGQKDIVVGSPIAGRNSGEVEGVVGCFVNMLALRTEVSAELTFRQLLNRVKDVTFEAYSHQQLPFEALVKELRPDRSLAAQPIFQVALSLHNYAEALPSTPRLSWSAIDTPSGATHFDLTLHLIEKPGEIAAGIEYAVDLFDSTTIERMAQHFQVLLQAVVSDPDCQVWKLPLLGEAEEKMLRQGWNDTAVPSASAPYIHELFSEQVRRVPTAMAVIDERHRLSYAELDEKANRLARVLNAAGVGPDSIVGVCLHRSAAMVVALLGVLKAGGAYLPLSPDLPPQRLRMMMEDAEVCLLITLPGSPARLIESAGFKIIPVEEADPNLLDDMAVFRRADQRLKTDYAVDRESAHLLPEHLAYVIYTSGSTGRPKGVLLHHRGLANLVTWFSRRFDLRPGVNLSQVASMMFDALAFEVWPALGSGATLVICPDSVRMLVEALHEWLAHHSINIAYLPTPVAEQVISSSLGIPASVQYLHTGGDVLHHAPRGPTAYKLTNNYGPTEITVTATSTEVAADTFLPPPIGKPIDNTEIHVLDECMRRVPLGVRGELYVSGTGVARGYLGLPGMTAERFMADPFGPSGTRMYRTGDVVRWRPDGNLEFLGRDDGQVKIRGFRIELSEIESALLGHPMVRQALVHVRETSSGERSLCAYVIPTHAEPHSTVIPVLTAHLKASLPDYMVPAKWVFLEQFPLTLNGKVDLKSLPMPDPSTDRGSDYEPPSGEAERALAEIWRELLSIANIGRKDNFFRLGGHSLLIMQMLDRLRRTGWFVDARRVFESPTLADLAAALSRAEEDRRAVPPNRIPPKCTSITPEMLTLVDLDVQHIAKITHSVPGGASNIQDIYPLVLLQEGILFHYLLNKDASDVYARPMLFELSAQISGDAFVRALQRVIDRHDILRTAILWEGVPRPVQVVCHEAALPVQEVVVDPSRGALEELRVLMREQQQRLNLSEPPLMRLQIARDGDDEAWYALLRTHHLIFDNTSLPFVLSEMTACLEGRDDTLPTPVPYRNYVAGVLSRANSTNSDAYFRGKLGDVDEPTAPFGVIEAHQEILEREAVCETLPLRLAERVLIQARRWSLTTAALFHAAWAMVLSLTTGRDDVVFGTVLLGRMQGSSESRYTVGMLVNTLPVRLGLQDITASDFVSRVQRELSELLNYEQSSLVEAQRCSGVRGDIPLFTTLFNYLRTSSEKLELSSDALGLRVIESEGGTNYPLSVSVSEEDGSFDLQVKADRRIGAKRMLAYMVTAVSMLTDALEHNPSTPVLAVSVLPRAERDQVIRQFNASRADYSQETLIHEWFEEQVKRTPDAIAVVYGHLFLTYAGLDAKADQLARYLRRRGVGPNQLVGLCVERGLEMMIGLLGILKAGGTYVPIDPNYPAERVHYILDDAAPEVLLSQSSLTGQLPDSGAEIIALDANWSEIGASSEGKLDPEVPGDDPHLAYVIYTSGSTGQPQGVMVEHRSVVDLWAELKQVYEEVRSCKNVALNASLNFDASVQQIIQLLSGRTVFVVPQEARLDADALLRFLKDNGIEAIDCTPTQLKSWVSAGLVDSGGYPLRMVLVGGEPIDAGLWQTLSSSSRIAFYNVYGPTECTVDTTIARVQPEDTSPHIGHPMMNRRVYILDSHRQPVPVGVPGELYIGGAGVARGYWNRPELTQERFIEDPFHLQGRMYKTGDMGKWRKDGTIEYLGRNDYQVKIRGFRIELGEIESQLLRHEQVREAVVLAREDIPGEKRLVAYVIPVSADRVVGAEALREHLKEVLPEYMVPSAFVTLERFPQTSSGKLDRRALPAPELGAYTSRQYEAPQGEVEEVLAGIWQELLHLERVGRRDNFFELGGHSLYGVRVIAKIAEKYDVELPGFALFRYPTIEALARYLDQQRMELAVEQEAESAEYDDGNALG